MVEIAKALSFDANVLIMDEPTAALSLPEVERLFSIVRSLRERDVAIFFIAHRLDEVFALTQRLTIMRDSMMVYDALTEDMSIDSIVSKMVGHDLDTFYPKADVTPGDVLLNVSIIGLLTAGMTIVMLMRHIDLSVASVVDVSAYAVGSLSAYRCSRAPESESPLAR